MASTTALKPMWSSRSLSEKSRAQRLVAADSTPARLILSMSRNKDFRGRRYSGMAQLIMPPGTENFSNTVTVVAELGQAQGGGKPRRAGADDGDFPGGSGLALLGGTERFGRSTAGCRVVVGHETFDEADGDGFVEFAAAAFGFAIGRAGPAADEGEGIALAMDGESFGVTALGHQGQVGGRVHAGGTGVDALARTSGLHWPAGQSLSSMWARNSSSKNRRALMTGPGVRWPRPQSEVSSSAAEISLMASRSLRVPWPSVMRVNASSSAGHRRGKGRICRRIRRRRT